MQEFEKNEKILIVTSGGVLKGKVKFCVDNKYFVHTTITDADGYLVKLNKVQASHVYPPEDFGRAINFFKSKYGV